VTTAFVLDARLAADTVAVTALPLCAVRLMNDRRYPWIILVPEIAGAREIVDLDAADRGRLIDEIAAVSTVMRDEFLPVKLNVAALGNVVAQLHIHVIARFTDDDAWPKPIWGTPAVPYEAEALAHRVETLRTRLAAFVRGAA
jgi:diadenosine tetraphosphate (Ap4A) HIT family hydrolase